MLCLQLHGLSVLLSESKLFKNLHEKYGQYSSRNGSNIFAKRSLKQDLVLLQEGPLSECIDTTPASDSMAAVQWEGHAGYEHRTFDPRIWCRGAIFI